jgi:hypothetical protein
LLVVICGLKKYRTRRTYSCVHSTELRLFAEESCARRLESAGLPLTFEERRKTFYQGVALPRLLKPSATDA